jgi:hypothetical protein
MDRREIRCKDKLKPLCLSKYHSMKWPSFFNEVPHNKAYWVSGGVAPDIFNVGTRWR